MHQDCAVLELSHLPVPQAEIMGGATAHPILSRFPANEPRQRLTQSCKKQKQTDQITTESTAVELNAGYGVYEADRIARSIPDKTVIPSDGPILICAQRSVFA